MMHTPEVSIVCTMVEAAPVVLACASNSASLGTSGHSAKKSETSGCEWEAMRGYERSITGGAPGCGMLRRRELGFAEEFSVENEYTWNRAMHG